MSDPNKLRDKTAYDCAIKIGNSKAGPADWQWHIAAALDEYADQLSQLLTKQSNRANGFQCDLAMAREALEFYADEKNYGGQGAPGNLVVTAKGDYWQEDVGHIAREALAAMQAEDDRETS